MVAYETFIVLLRFISMNLHIIRHLQDELKLGDSLDCLYCDRKPLIYIKTTIKVLRFSGEAVSSYPDRGSVEVQW